MIDISLLTIEEAEALPKNIREYGGRWWLRTPGDYPDDVTCVHLGGSIINSIYVGYNNYAVRPVITVSNLKDLKVSIRDTIFIQGQKYVVISDNKILYNDEVVYHRFSNESNDYDKSEIKKIVDNWLK